MIGHPIFTQNRLDRKWVKEIRVSLRITDFGSRPISVKGLGRDFGSDDIIGIDEYAEKYTQQN